MFDIKFYITEELSEKLRGKNYPIVTVYENHGFKPVYYELPKEHPDWQYCYAWYLPRIDEVLDWLRISKGIHLYSDIKDDGWFYDVSYNITEYDDCFEYDVKPLDNNDGFKTYRESILNGIDYIVENLL